MSNEKNSEKIQLIEGWSFNRINYIIFFIGVLFIVFGYIIMATGETESIQSVKISPLILIVGYCVVIPAAILVKPKNKD